MSRKPLNTLPIENFLEQVKVATKTNQRELKLPDPQYKDLGTSISLLMARLVELQDNNTPTEESINVQMDGGNF